MTGGSARSAHVAAASDTELVLRVLNGDREAFGLLVTRHQQALYRHARGMGLDHDTALDLVQDTCVRAWTRLAECRAPGQVRGWMFRILRNLVLDHRKNLRQRSVSLEVLEESGEITDHRHAVDPTTGLAVADALDQLPPLLREAFLLRHDAGYSYDEAAAMVGASPSAVKMRVHRAREVLVAALTGRPSREARG